MGLFDSISGFFGDVLGGIFDQPAPRTLDPWGTGQRPVFGEGPTQWEDIPERGTVGHNVGGLLGGLAGQLLPQLIGGGSQRQVPGPGSGPIFRPTPTIGCPPNCGTYSTPGTIGGWPGMTPPAPRPAPSRDQVLGYAPRLTQPSAPGSGPDSAQSMVQQASPAAILPAIGVGLDIVHETYPGGVTGAARDVWNWATTDIRDRTHPGWTGGGMRDFPVTLPGGAMVSGQSQVGRPYGGMVFRNAPSGPRARSVLQIQNPYTGRTMWYRNMGTPILWSGDLSSAKRVRKAASRARRGR